MSVLTSCTNPENELEELISNDNTIDAYNRFIKKYVDKPIVDKAENIRDLLAYDQIKKEYSIEIDSLKNFNDNICLNLIENAKHLYEKSHKIEKNLDAVEILEKSGKYYFIAGLIQEKVGLLQKEILKKSAYSYYTASKRSQQKQMESTVSFFSNYLKSLSDGNKSFNQREMATGAAVAIAPDHLTKSVLYEKSVEIFRKAGLNKQAEWMMKSNNIENFTYDEIIE